MAPFYDQHWVMQQWDDNCPISRENHDTVCIVTECSNIIENSNKLALYALDSVHPTDQTKAARERIIKYFAQINIERVNLLKDLIEILNLPKENLK